MKVLFAASLLLAAALSGCASAPEQQDTSLARQEAPKRKCKAIDAPRTGSAIARTECNGPEVQVVDPRDLMDSKRVAVPDPLGARGR